MRGAWVHGVGVLLLLGSALGLAGCGYEEGQAYGRAEAKKEWYSPTAGERGDELRDRLQLTQTDH